MFGSGSLFRDFDEDPFFSDFHRRHRQNMSSMLGDFGMGFGPHDPFLAITNGHHSNRAFNHQSRSTRHPQQQLQMAPFGMFDMFSNMNRMMADMHRNFDGVANTPSPNGHAFSHSSFTSYSNTGDGAPKVYQATSSTRQAPGGIKEIRKTVRDSAAGIEKMAVGHHINDRSHTIKKSRNTRSKDMEEEQEFINLDESDAKAFDDEWQTKTRHHRPAAVQDRSHKSRPRYSPAITDGRIDTQQPGEQRRKRTHRESENDRTRVGFNSQPKY
ncbi:myeloid leukemia factor 2-like [Antedon mediterranea]|uniref:myeloid leukemia factor 2-like n=1 Tax=Antedon mediterranea TaxID=105859 RepID=UPI003AF549B0